LFLLMLLLFLRVILCSVWIKGAKKLYFTLLPPLPCQPPMLYYAPAIPPPPPPPPPVARTLS